MRRSLYAFCGAVTMHLEEGNQPTDVPLTAEENPPPPLVDVRSLLCLACHLLRLGCSKGDSEDLPAPMAGDEARVPLLCLARASLRAALSLTQQPAPPLVPWPDISCLMWYDLADCLLAAVHTVEGDTSMASGAVAAAGTGRLADGSGGSGSSSLAQSLTTTAAHGQLLVEVVVLVGQATAALSGRLQQLQQLGAQDSVEVAGEGEAASAKERPSLLAAVAAATRLQAWATAAMHKELVAAWAQVQRAEEEGKAQVQRAVEEGRAQLQRAKEEGRAQVQRTEQDAQAEAAQLQERLTVRSTVALTLPYACLHRCQQGTQASLALCCAPCTAVHGPKRGRCILCQPYSPYAHAGPAGYKRAPRAPPCGGTCRGGGGPPPAGVTPPTAALCDSIH